MLTPAFELGQDEKFVYVYIKTPYIKISDVEYFIEDRCFKFYVKPYFLRLNFPEKIVENGDESASYDVDKGLFTVRLPKLIVGAHFPDLDLVTKLLAPSGKCNVSSPGIEVISQETADDSDDDDIEDEDDFDWEYSQEIYDEEREKQLGVVGSKYGFANQKGGVFYRLKDELKDVVENPNPDELSYSERRLARMAAEDGKFDEEHYLADFFEDKRIKEILSYVIEKEVSFSEIEKEKHRQLPNREYILNHKDEISVCYSLVDIIFAFAYNKRTTFGESTVESAWTISKMSSTLSWFERFTSLDEVLNACVRRSLSYPLYRHWELTCKVLQDAKDIFQIGRRMILTCLLEILMMFNASEPRYLLNELYITDYCIWIQKVKERKIESLTKKLLEANITKDSVGWDLKELETAAILVYNEQRSSSSDSKSSSSDDSTDDNVDEAESDDSSDNDSTGPEIAREQASKCSKKASFSEGKMENGEVDALCTPLDVQNKNPFNLVIEKSETDSENETVRKIEVLPSLLCPKQGYCGKKLVEVISGGEDADDKCSAKNGNANIDESVCFEDLGADKLIPNRSVDKEEKELVSVKEANTELGLSCKISELALN